MTIRFLSPTAAAYDTSRIESDQTMMAEFFAQSAQAIDGKGRPVYVRDNGSGATRRYTWELIVPDGSDTLTQLTWNDTLGLWEPAEAPRNTFNNYPWFVLTQDDDADQVVEAIEYFLANRDSHGNTDQTGQTFRVTGGVTYPRGLQDFTTSPNITDVWPEGGPPAWWWAIVAADGDREEGYWIRYRTSNEAQYNVRIAVHTTDDPAAGDWGAAFASGQQRAFNLPVFTADSRISVWLSVDNPINGYFMGEQSSDGQDTSLVNAQDAQAPLTLGGVDGFYRKGNATVPAATHSGAERSIYNVHAQISVEHVQPDPTFGTAGFRVGGTVYDWAKGEIAGDRPDSPSYRKTGQTPWSSLDLAYTAPAPASDSVEKITTLVRSPRGIPDGGGFEGPAMYYGWTDTRREVDFATLRSSDDLRGVIPRHHNASARLTIWAADTALRGLHCFELLVAGDPDRLTCDTEPQAAPDGRPGRLFVPSGPTSVDDYVDRTFRIVPSAGA